jgi:hypothetical protein
VVVKEAKIQKRKAGARKRAVDLRPVEPGWRCMPEQSSLAYYTKA